MSGSVDLRAARRLGIRLGWLIAAFAVLLSAVPALAEPRIALVIGNGRYQTVPELKNPVSDAELISGVLRSVGFEVTLLTDSDQAGMKRAIADFGRALRAAGPDTTGLFYYAGHGVQAQGLNYLLPVDGAVQDAADLDLVGVQADWVLRQLFSARNRTNIIILDACRNNPFASFGTDAAPGLAEMIAPTGTFIAYSSAPGSVAVDGAGSNSPFSLALAESMATPGQAIEQIFKQVRVAVLGATQGYQTTWDSSSLTGDFYFEPTAPADPREVAAEQLWNSLKDAADPVQIIMFLRTYPDSKVSGEARALLEQSLAKELAPAAAAPAPAPAAPVAAAPAPAAPAAAPAGPSPREVELIERAQASGALADYEAYAAEFPEGVFKDLVAAEILARQAAAPAPAPAPAAPESPPPAAAAPPAEVAAAGQPITFLTPLTRGAAPVAGRSIAEIILGSPQYPPVEGLPESYWKTQTCSNCHQWTKEALCQQGQTYLTATGEFALDKQHPIDGFKQVLREWAASGCQ